MKRPSVVIVSPALAAANNGNWQTASRWRRMLAPVCERVRIEGGIWDAASGAGDTVMLALHARRSAASIDAWHAARGPAGLAVVLTGTDLYDDLSRAGSDAQRLARRSIEQAAALVVLQARGVDALPAALRDKAHVIEQSAPSPRTAAPMKPAEPLRVLACGHLRNVKSPETVFAAARALAGRGDIVFRHLGGAADAHDQVDTEAAALVAAARETEAVSPHYRWIGAQPHARTLLAIARAHVLVHPSRMEGGAHVILEAVTGGTPVLASRVPGNVGMLGEDYEGYFEPGDVPCLVRLLLDCRQSQDDSAGLLNRLKRQCDDRRPMFEPARERRLLRELLSALPHAPDSCQQAHTS